MSLVPRALARRLDRLARRAHAFHRFAHHPLCSAYRAEVVRLGRRAVCRGCLLAAAGTATGVALGALAPAPSAGALALGLASTAAALAAAAAPGRSARRRSKLLTRAAPAALAAALATSGLAAGGLARVAAGLSAVAMALAATALYRRRGPDRSPCLACPEREGPRVCSGFRRIARREAAFARLAGKLLRP